MSRTSSLLDDGDSYQYRSHDEEVPRSGFGPSGSGLTGAASGFYHKNRKAILISLGVTLAVIILIIVIAVAAGGKGEGNDPSNGPMPVHLGDLTAYRMSSTGPLLAYFPDITGVSAATLALASQYASAGYQVYVLDYFDGGNGFGNGSIPSVWTIPNSTARARLAVADLRAQFPGSKIFSTGYCWGGGVGVALTYGTPAVDVSVVAHAAQVSPAMYQQAVSPLLAIMPQYDAGFNNQAGAFMGSITCAGCRGHVAMFKVYPGVSHGFAVTVNMSDPNAVKQKQAAFDDTRAFFTLQTQLSLSQEADLVLPPLQQTGSNVTLAGMNTYHTGSGSRLLLYLMDINGWRKTATDLADSYAQQGFNVFMPDYCNGGFSCNGVNVEVATTRVRSAISELRAQYPTSKVYSTGYCYGGGVGLRLAGGGMNGVDASAVAHASAVNVTIFTAMTAPLLAVMPQNDNGFNNQVPLYMSTLTCSFSNCSREAAFKVYPGVNHGFAVTVNMSDPNAVMQKQQAFLDTVNFFNQHQ